MKNSRKVWNHEVRQADKIARKLIGRDARKGSKKERALWFKKVEEVSRNAMMEEVQGIFPGG